jgi:Zn finger protein HypA/HybF involved in hydrogenase expression
MKQLLIFLLLIWCCELKAQDEKTLTTTPIPPKSGEIRVVQNPCIQKCIDMQNRDYWSASDIGIGLSQSSAKKSAMTKVMISIGEIKNIKTKKILGSYLDEKNIDLKLGQKERIIEVATLSFETELSDFETLCEQTIQTRNQHDQLVYECQICGRVPKNLKGIKPKLVAQKISKEEELPRELNSEDMIRYLIRDLEK